MSKVPKQKTDLLIHLYQNVASSVKDEYETNFDKIVCQEYTPETITDAFKTENFLLTMKPFIFDLLKRINRVQPIIEVLQKADLQSNMKNQIKTLKERDIICGLIESVPPKSHPRLGFLISKNDYPIPLYYKMWSSERKELEYKTNFDLLEHILCLTDKSLGVISTTTNKTVCDPKSSFKQSLVSMAFPILNGKSIYEYAEKYSIGVDILCNNEANKEWIVADFNGFERDHDFDLLLKSFAAYSSFHLLIASLDDFDQDTPNDEIKAVIEWYNKIGKKNFTIFLVICDNLEKKKEKDSDDEFGDDDEFEIKKKVIEDIQVKLKNDFGGNIHAEFFDNNLTEKIYTILNYVKKESIHSIQDIKSFYDYLKFGNFNAKICFSKSSVEENFEKLFNPNNDQDSFKDIFEVSRTIREIADIDKKITSYAESDSGSLVETKNRLNAKLKSIENFNEQISFFISIVLESDSYVRDLFIFEKCLLDMKKPKIEELQEKRKQLSQLLEKSPENEKHKIFIKLKKLRTDLEDNDMTLDKFWIEVFFYFDLDHFKYSDEYKELMKKIVDKYLDLVTNHGFSIHILHGNPLKVSCEFLDLFFKKITNLTNISVLSVIGDQSSAKSSLLNSLFGFDFRIGVGRCTVGIYMSWLKLENDQTLLVLDTEGLGSIENENYVFDNQMATMCALSSNLILVNHKGELSSNLKRMLEITYYAKLRISNSSFKPTVTFVLRDQNDNDKEVRKIQADKLKEEICKSIDKIQSSAIDEVLNIDTQNLFLLPNAFSQDVDPITKNEVLWRNMIFPKRMLNFRQSLLDSLQNSKQNEDSFLVSINIFYQKMIANWKTLEAIGSGILECKDLEEIKIRTEISVIAVRNFEEYFDILNKELSAVIETSLMSLIESFSDSKCNKTLSDLNYIYEEILSKMKEEFQKNTKSRYNDKLKNEFLESNESKLQGGLKYHENYFNLQNIEIRRQANFQEAQAKMINNISEILKSDNLDEFYFANELSIKLKELDKAQEEDDKHFLNPEKIKKDIIKNNQYVLKDLPYKEIKDLANKNISLDDDIMVEKWINPEKISVWLNKSSFIEKLGGMVKEIIIGKKNKYLENPETELTSELFSDFQDELIPKIKNLIRESKEVNTVSIIKKMYEELHLYLFDKNSIYFQNKKYFDKRKLINDLILKLLSTIFNEIQKIQAEKRANNLLNFKKKRDEIEKRLKKDFQNKKNCLDLGKDFGENFFKIFINFINKNAKFAIDKGIRDIVNLFFKNPESLVDEAYKQSFDSLNYENVFKYVLDVKRFCGEVLEKTAQSKINSFVKKIFLQLKNECYAYLKFLISEFQKKSEFVKFFSARQFFDVMLEFSSNHKVSLTKNKNIFNFNHFINNVTKEEMTNINIEDSKLFLSGFLNSLKEKLDIYDEFQMMDEFLKMFDYRDFSSFTSRICKEYTDFYVGCESRCPRCGAKCQYPSNHPDKNHKSNKHMLCCFSGWRYLESKKIINHFCWGKAYLNPVVENHEQENEKKYPNSEAYLAECHPDWLQDIKTNYEQFGRPECQKHEQLVDHITKVERCWMNCRKPLIKHFKVVDKDDYDYKWRRYEDENSLPEDYKPKWKDE